MTSQIKSKQYKSLEKRINQIEKHFDFKQSINGITPLQSDRLRGFILLCHAEFEDYFESVALRLLEEAEDKWDKNKIANYNLASLFIYHEKITKSDTNESKAKKIIKDYRQMVKDNHGIKEHNIKQLFEPLGYKMDDFNSSFISTLSSFGGMRGETAHTSAKKTQQLLDKDTEVSRVKDLLEGAFEFEQML